VALNISNETKVGSLAIVAVRLLILGFNFLNGEELFQTSYTLTARYKNIDGLIPGNKVVINGLQVGSVKDLKLDQKNRFDIRHFYLEKGYIGSRGFKSYDICFRFIRGKICCHHYG